eukprot:scaffold18473_cov54-Phaeocystis_antarctica.AAC.4
MLPCLERQARLRPLQPYSTVLPCPWSARPGCNRRHPGCNRRSPRLRPAATLVDHILPCPWSEVSVLSSHSPCAGFSGHEDCVHLLGVGVRVRGRGRGSHHNPNPTQGTTIACTCPA